MNLIRFSCFCSNVSLNFHVVFHFLCFSYLGQQIYKQALQYHKIIPKRNAAASLTIRSSLSAANRSSSPGSLNPSALNENEVKFKIATCHNSLNENKAALAEMEGIPSKSRNLEMNLMMAKLYRNSRHTRAAIGCFKECLRNCPYILDAIIVLAELGVSAKDIISLFPQAPKRSGRPPFDYSDSSRWLLRYVEAQCCVASNDYKGGLELFSELLQRFPNNIHILLEMAKVKAVIGKNDEAILDFEKSLRIDERHVAGYIMKGNLFLSINRPEAAVVAYRGAQELRPDLRSYQGLVRSYLALSKIKEALFVAREAMKPMPQSAKALKLVGDVHASSSSGREKAKKFYESALRLEPGFLGAALALAELHVQEGRNGDAASLLQGFLKDWADDSLHAKLAQVFAATSMLQEALSHYQAALRINPLSDDARKGLERLEKQRKGVDPDAPEEDKDNEADDAEVDPDDADLL
ncbi:anaphase-promoting complex subunit 7-like isoform X3 [Primulina tabacum]|uniref:anaphase-promoting complex subunit 7-like isoform X3 n=1 Tax=Primulina tabacum TaxID=48773 RepID=UPI003F595B51